MSEASPTIVPLLTHDEIVAREQAVYDAAIAARTSPIEALSADRALRWAAIVPTIVRPQALTDWAARMTALHGPFCKMHYGIVGWITGLLICRYGEAEYHWPTEFSERDVIRALEWERGKLPEGCRHLTPVV